MIKQERGRSSYEYSSILESLTRGTGVFHDLRQCQQPYKFTSDVWRCREEANHALQSVVVDVEVQVENKQKLSFASKTANRCATWWVLPIKY